MLERLARPWSRLWDGTAKLMDAIYGGLGRPGKLLQDFLNGSGSATRCTRWWSTWSSAVRRPRLLLQILSWFGVADLRVATCCGCWG